MKHFINILVIFILTFFTIGIVYVTLTYGKEDNHWGFLFLPLIGMMLLWGFKISNDYKD